MTKYLISHPTSEVSCSIPLESSKSESNRALIIKALSAQGSSIENVSMARDTQTMLRLLASTDDVLDVIDAGTTMRFLTAYCAVTGRKATLTGTPRMCERPIGILVEALRTLGARIDYVQKEGYPPLLVHGIAEQHTNKIQVRGDVSSQFISALAMIGPILPQGLTVQLTGKVGSVPYIRMTLSMMKDFGAMVLWDEQAQEIKIQPGGYAKTQFYVESDWSGASYWYAIAALAKKSRIELQGLKARSLQGDAAIAQILQPWGVQSEFGSHTVTLTKLATTPPPETLVNFENCPDIAQTVSAIAAGLNISLRMSGVESLKIKETDRLAAMRTELAKVGVHLDEGMDKVYSVNVTKSFRTSGIPEFDTYDDHRMAMALAPLALCSPIVIKDPSVVVKSYPTFWDHLRLAGFEIKAIS